MPAAGCDNTSRTHLWPSSSHTKVPFPCFMQRGNGEVCSKVRVLPPGSNSTANSCCFLENRLLATYLDCAAARASAAS